MPWSSEVNKDIAEKEKKEAALSGMKDMNIADEKPLGGMGRGRRPIVKNANGNQSTSPGSFSFKLNSTTGTDASISEPSAATSLNSNPAGFGSNFGSSFGSGFGSDYVSSSSGSDPKFGTFAAKSVFNTGNVKSESNGGFNTADQSKHVQNGVPTLENTKQTLDTNPTSEDTWEEDERTITKEEQSMLNKIVHDKLVKIKSLNIDLKNRKDLDPNSPLFSLKTFEELRLRKELLEGIACMGYMYPSKIQEATLPLLLADPPQNIIAQSQSGTGKTAAFVLTMLSRVDPSIKAPQCLCLAPTYELALQIGTIVETMGKFCPDITVTYAIRGRRQMTRGQRVTEHIIIGTPGTALDWMIKFKCFDPALIKVFVLDEADVMISQQGHQDQSIRMHKQLTEECQRLFFSATYDDEVMDFAHRIVADPVTYTVQKEDLPLENVKQYYVECGNKEEKYRALSNIYGSITIGQSMIFCHTKKTASWLASQMTADGHSVGLLSSDLDITQRAAVITRFRNAFERCLICTNVCARGLDIEQVTVVINFDLPVTVKRTPDYETYLHRIGRTGRFGKSGLAINFIEDSQSRAILKDIEKYFNKKILKLDASDMEALEHIDQ